MTVADLPMLKEKLDRHVALVCLSGEEILGDLLEVCEDGISIDVDISSDHDLAGGLLFVSLEDIDSIRETPSPPFPYVR